jgi:hypothetical protein
VALHTLIPLLAFMFAVALSTAAPIRFVRPGSGTRSEQAARRAELHAAKKAKYREICDVQTQWRLGHISDEAFEARTARLHAETIAILKQLEELD